MPQLLLTRSSPRIPLLNGIFTLKGLRGGLRKLHVGFDPREEVDGVFGVVAAAAVALVMGAGGMEVAIASVEVEAGEGLVGGRFARKEVVCFEGDVGVVVDKFLRQINEVNLAASAF